MNTQTFNKHNMRSILVAVAAAAMLLVISITPSFGQVERVASRDALSAASFMTSGEISDDLEGNDDEYFYKFKAGPGKLTITLEVTANETNAGAMLDLLGPNDKAIISNMLVQAADRGSEMAFQSVTLAKAQDIIIRIKGMKYGSSARYPGVYKISLAGTAVKFNDVAPPAGLDQSQIPAAPPPLETDQSKNTDVPQPDGVDQENVPAQSGAVPPAATPPAKTGQVEKPDAVDRAVEKGKKKSKKLLDILEKVKTKIPE